MSHERTSLLQDEERDAARNSESPPVDTPTPLPWRSLFVLLLLTAAQPLAFEIIFPFVNQMILEIGVVTDPERVGFYSGLIESIFSCMSFIAIMPSSYLANRIGRKPVVLGGLTGLAISVASFGMSKSFLAMVLSRCLGGALGGAWVCTRIMIGEMSDKSNQASAFQWLSVSYRSGQIIGLPLGGLLAHPARRFSPFQTKFWYEYPFALPCFVGAAFTLCSVTMGYFTLRETLPSKKKSIRKPTYGTNVSLSIDGTSTATASIDDSTTATGPPKSVNTPSLRSILTPSVVSVLVSNLVVCLTSETFFALFPLFAFTPISSGGLGLSEAAIGTLLAIRAVFQVGMMGFYAPLEKRFGSTVRLYRWIMWTWPLTVLCAPLLNYLARQGGVNTWYSNLVFFVFFVLWSTGGFLWTSISIMITNSAPSAEALATLNGLSQMAIVLPQAIAPASITSLFAFSIKSGIAGGSLVWICLFAFTCAAAIHGMTLHEPSSDWRKDDQTSTSQST